MQTSGAIPNAAEILLISDIDFDAFSGSVDAEHLYRSFTHAYICETCGTTWVFKNGLDGEPVGYAPIVPE